MTCVRAEETKKRKKELDKSRPTIHTQKKHKNTKSTKAQKQRVDQSQEAEAGWRSNKGRAGRDHTGTVAKTEERRKGGGWHMYIAQREIIDT
ncbi:hypothetical protein HETIRDRAFT_412567 [Heterobasidion irregulare TC 32-1]|uniref:Uncharacterized protein n=1 Tax=Heterobasidion irregulare (strain TC 32-1) TaxID=747525 RepID=W4JPS0_HETIT|nr:uncharacterized protein HETIRDRAFT_412567 [Heterobasidion irregulare TC 32-1]ETW75464.1 hypothetical protein HETIRDRAFT_412567 [Heterobasidion irregulare TC 32-1]